ncbi:MAG: helix-turn-helix transcriptional regulator [Oscillospiraceae bacterium]|nr:helix-turn-helix transcriptional regulator [Oscillospiraceae bacterium]
MSELLQQLERVRTENLSAAYLHPPYILECELSSAMAACDREKSLELLRTINAMERARLSDNPLQSLQFSLCCGCTIFTRTSIRAGVDAETAFNLSDLFIRRIGKAHTSRQLMELENTMLMGFIDLIEHTAAAKTAGNPTVRQIVQYIQNNINHRITLADISREVGLHPVYVSSLFTEKMGVSVTEFIDLSRVRVIESFLAESDMKLLDIAELFSFSSAAHFSTFFKRHTGMTPREYRAEHRKKS